MRRVQAVLIGANQVDGLPEVPAALDAVEVMHAFLQARTTIGSNIRVLCGPEATRHAVDTALHDAAAALQVNDLCVVMFSGHGFDDGNEQAWQLADGLFTDAQLAAYVNEVAKACVFVVPDDSCFAARMFKPGPEETAAHFQARFKAFVALRHRRCERLVNRIASPGSFVLAASASSVQVHADDHSEFTRTLCSAVKVCNATVPIDHYKDVVHEMRHQVPEPKEQANWTIQGRSPGGSDLWKTLSPLRV